MAAVSPYASFYEDTRACAVRGSQQVARGDVELQVRALERMVMRGEESIRDALRHDAAATDAWWTCSEMLAAAAHAEDSLQQLITLDTACVPNALPADV